MISTIYYKGSATTTGLASIKWAKTFNSGFGDCLANNSYDFSVNTFQVIININ